MTTRGAHLFARLRGGLERLGSRPLGALLLFLLAGAAYALRAVAWPLTSRTRPRRVPARLRPALRPPRAPAVVAALPDADHAALRGGAPRRFGGPLRGARSWRLLYAGSIVCWAAAARCFGRWAALAVAAALLLYQGYALMFHELSSEPVFAAAFALWALLVVARGVRADGTVASRSSGWASPCSRSSARGTPCCSRSRSCPLLLGRSMARAARADRRVRSRRRRSRSLAWSVHNGVRFDSWGLARGGNAIIPFYRAFITDHIVSPENGEDSRRLAAAMQQHLLTREPYRSYGVTLDRALRDGSFRVHEDLYLLSDQVFGWDDDYARPPRRRVSRACAPIPASTPAAWRGRSGTSSRRRSSAPSRRPPAEADGRPPATVVIDGKRLPAPTEGEPIPSGQVVWISRPDNSIRQVWTSPTEWHFEFAAPARTAALRAHRTRGRRALRRTPRPRGQRAARAAPEPALALVPAPVDVDPARPVAIALRRPRGGRSSSRCPRRFRRGIPERARPLRRPPLRAPGRAGFVLFGLAGLLGIRGPRTVTRRIPTRTTTPSSTS